MCLKIHLEGGTEVQLWYKKRNNPEQWFKILFLPWVIFIKGEESLDLISFYVVLYVVIYWFVWKECYKIQFC